MPARTLDTISTAHPTPPGSRRRVVAWACSGVLAAGVVLGVGELLAVPIGPDASPFYAAGSATVDRSPVWAREFAIQTFSTNDKPALFIGMSVLIVLAAALAGMLEATHRPFGSAILAALGLIGVAAALQRPGATWTYAIPTTIGVIVGIVVLRALTSATATAPDRTPDRASHDARMPRRRFLILAASAAALAAAAGAVGRHYAQRIAEVAENRRTFTIPTVIDTAAPIPAGADIGVEGATPFRTPTAHFYRVDTALQVPRLTTDEWHLRIHGMVDREITMRWDDLAARTPIERIITLTCVSNEVGGSLAGNATWIGYPIGEILDEVGVHPDADMLLSTSVDGFTVGTPVQVLRDGRDALLAVTMNGEPLPLEHGYPVRQVVPGLYGYVSATKWVVDWELTRFDRAQAYWTPRGWSEKAPIKTASRIDVPSASASVAPGRVTIAGTAWAQHRGIAAVEIRVDDGPWQQATLAPQVSIDTWRQWIWEWAATTGTHTLEVRATDLDGKLQTGERTPPMPDGATGWHTRRVIVG